MNISTEDFMKIPFRRVSIYGAAFLICLVSVFVFKTSRKPCEVHKTVCLNMIVKNESKVIEKCLGSVKPLIDYWVIVDTGSNDKTQDIIKNFMKDIPGELHERPWVNFEHNRNEALDLARDKADYLLMIDADECLKYDDHFSLPKLDKDSYDIVIRQIGAVDFMRSSIVNTKLPWKWSGVLHETLGCSVAKTGDVLKGVMNLCNTNVLSGRSVDPDKYLKDAAVLEEALKKEPNNSRYVFYLAQSYMASGKLELALKNYEKRVSMPSSDLQETFFAIYNVGKAKENMGDPQGAIDSYFKAHAFRPNRAEPVFRAAVISRRMGNPFLGYLLSKQALSIPRPEENCVEYNTYDHAILIEFANCALLTGRWQEGLDASNKLLANPNLPAEARPSVVANIELAKKNLYSTATLVKPEFPTMSQ
jgi:tetratricopeptide (TPR) repeat protein